jgi:hypothetical protein
MRRDRVVCCGKRESNAWAIQVERSPQNNREGGAKRYREMKLRAKKPKA